MRRFDWRIPAYAAAGCGHGSHHHPFTREFGSPVSFFSGMGEGTPFGVKRPLRFLAYKLELDDPQVAELARILDELKTERAQAAVDDRRTLTAFADAFAGAEFDTARAGEGAALRQTGSERLRNAVLAALPRIHALLKPEQRERFAYLIRTGAVAL
jgi:Spy/CpxP family protein refolding chaperone